MAPFCPGKGKKKERELTENLNLPHPLEKQGELLTLLQIFADINHLPCFGAFFTSCPFRVAPFLAHTDKHTLTHTHTHTYTHTHTSTKLHTHKHTLTHSLTHTHIYTHTHTHTHTLIAYIHTYIHTVYIHTYIHT